MASEAERANALSETGSSAGRWIVTDSEISPRHQTPGRESVMNSLQSACSGVLPRAAAASNKLANEAGSHPGRASPSARPDDGGAMSEPWFGSRWPCPGVPAASVLRHGCRGVHEAGDRLAVLVEQGAHAPTLERGDDPQHHVDRADGVDAH